MSMHGTTRFLINECITQTERPAQVRRMEIIFKMIWIVFYLQWSDLVRGNPRDVGGPDAYDGLLGAAACWRASESLFQKSRLTQAAQRHTEQSPNPESWRHLSCRARMCKVFFCLFVLLFLLRKINFFFFFPGGWMRWIVVGELEIVADGTARFHPAPWNAALAAWHQQISCSFPSPFVFIIYLEAEGKEGTPHW